MSRHPIEEWHEGELWLSDSAYVSVWRGQVCLTRVNRHAQWHTRIIDLPEEQHERALVEVLASYERGTITRRMPSAEMTSPISVSPYSYASALASMPSSLPVSSNSACSKAITPSRVASAAALGRWFIRSEARAAKRASLALVRALVSWIMSAPVTWGGPWSRAGWRDPEKRQHIAPEMISADVSVVTCGGCKQTRWWPQEPAPDERRECRKRRHPSKRRALESNRSNGANLRAYRCPDCGYWHVTRQRVWKGLSFQP